MQLGQYSKITLNKSLNQAGFSGSSRPDVIGVARRGRHLFVEVTSKSQTHQQMAMKLVNITKEISNSHYHIIDWAATLGRWLI